MRIRSFYSSNSAPLTGKQLAYEPDAFISSLNYDSEDIMPSSIKSTGADSISGSYPELNMLRKQKHSI